MAIFHCEVKSISRSDGRTSTAAASYRAGAKIKDERTQTQYDYTRKQNVIDTYIVLPSDIELKIDRAELWNKAEFAEKRKDAKVAREYEIALPAELPPEVQRQLAITFAQTIADRFHVAADVAIHKPDRKGDQRNVHAHILTTTRRIDERGELGEKTRELDTKPTSAKHVEAIREIWAALVNDELEKHGVKERVDHRTLAAQGIDRAPQIHVGVHATQMERRGIETERGAENRKRQELNKRVDELKAELTAEQEKAAAAVRAKTAAKNAPEKPQPTHQKAVSPSQKPVEAPKTAETPKTTPKPQDMAKKAVLGADKAKRIGIYAIYDGVMDGQYCITCDEEPLVGPFETGDKAAAYLDGHQKEIEQLAADYKHGQPIQMPREYYTRKEIWAAKSALSAAEARLTPQIQREDKRQMAKKLAPYWEREETLHAEIKQYRENEPQKRPWPLETKKAFQARYDVWHDAFVAKIDELDSVRKEIEYIRTHVDPWRIQLEAKSRAQAAEPEAAHIVAWAEKQEKLEREERRKEKLQQKSRGWELGD